MRLSTSIYLILYQQVDTSGLPSNLHNDNGRRIVGIILICVAVATMALSASVGFFYFVVCNRKPQHPSPATAGAARGAGRGAAAGDVQQGKHRHQNHHHGGGRGANGVPQQRSGGAGSPADGRHARLAPTERTRSRDSVRTGSQQSLRAAVAGVGGDTPGGGASRPSPHSGRPPGSRYHHKRSQRSHHKSRGFRPGAGRYRSGLEPHQEEDVEAAKSVVDLNRTAAVGSSSTAVISLTSEPKQAKSHQAWGEEGREETELERPSSSGSPTRPPTIVLSNAMEEGLHPLNTDDSLSVLNNSSNTMDTQLLLESDTMNMLGDTFNSTADLVSQDSTLSEEYQQKYISTDFSEQQEPHVSKQSSGSNVDRLESSYQSSAQPSSGSIIHPHSSPHKEPHQQSDANPAIHSVSSLSSSSSISMSPSQSSVLQVKPETAAATLIELDTSTKSKEKKKHRRHKEGSRDRSHRRHHQREDEQQQAENMDKSSSYSETEFQTVPTHQNAPQNPMAQVEVSDSHSQAPQLSSTSVPHHRDNPAFSHDGGDPDPEETADLRKIQEYMEELMDESGDV